MSSHPLRSKWFSRKRISISETGFFPPDVTLFTFLSQAVADDPSAEAAVDRVNAGRSARGLTASSPNTGNYIKAKQRLKAAVIEKLAKRAGADLELQSPEAWKWNGRSVKLLDGSTLLLADTSANQVEFPQQKNQKKGSGFPIARLVALISMANGAVLDLAMGAYKGKETGEMALARELLGSLSSGDIILADRYFCSYFFIALLQQAGVDIVTRLHGARIADFRKGKRLERGDHLIELKKPQKPDWMDEAQYASMPDGIIVREVKAKLACPGFRDEDLVVVTTLLDYKKYRLPDLVELYDQRWHCELDLRNLKTTMALEMLRSKSPEMAEKELWATLLAYNLIRKMMAQAASAHDSKPRLISFSGTINTFLAFQAEWTTDYESNARLYLEMLALIAKKKVGNRPGRREPRMLKRRPKPFPRLQGSRHDPRNNGGTKMAKR